MMFFQLSRAMTVAMLAVLTLGMGSAGAQDLGEAVKGSYLTNLSMLSESAESALNELFLGFSGPEGARLRVESADDHEANWFVENLILTRLTDAGYSAYLKEAPRVGPVVPAQFRDSTDTGEEDEDELLSEEEEAPRLILRYRVAEFGIQYPETHRKSPLGSRQVQRLASVSVFANLLQGKAEDVVWVGRGDAERTDIVPAGKLPLLEGKTFPFSKPFLEPGGLGSLVEPALVTGIVVGLIYLFYTNQN